VSGLLVAFEGIDGSGKSTVQAAVADRLRQEGVPVLTTFEPGGSDLGGRLRPLLLDADLDARTQLLLFAAERARHVRHVIRPALHAGAVVLCDRFEASSIAYQSHWLGLPEDDVRSVSRFASNQLRPHLTVWLDADVALARSRRGGEHPDRFDVAAQAAGASLSASFARQAAAEPDRWLRLDASDTLQHQVETAVTRILAASAAHRRAGTLLLVCGPSGAGKNTIVERLVAERDDVTFSVSATTRTPRDGERDGVDYLFVTDDDFDALVADGGVLEWATYAGHRYGTPAGPVVAALAAGRHVVAIVELSGAEQIRALHPEAPIVFISAHPDELADRLASRGSETVEQRRQRLHTAHQELAWGPTVADVVADGGDADTAVATLAALLPEGARAN
jgi:guanylate kinase/dTMP kinase